MGTKALFMKDETSIPKRLAGAFASKRCNEVRFIQPHGWVVRGADEFWQADLHGALRLAREFCDATAKILRSITLSGEAMAAEVLRLSEYEPAMREPIPAGEVLGGVWL